MDEIRLAYLDAMGIDVWQPRQAADESATEPQIALSDGDGDIMCLVAEQSDSSRKLAKAIGSAMRCQPVWAWPAETDSEITQSPDEAVREKMLTQVLIFGQRLAASILGENVPAVISTARIHVVPGLDELAADKNAKRQLWRLMNESGIAAGKR